MKQKRPINYFRNGILHVAMHDKGDHRYTIELQLNQFSLQMQYTLYGSHNAKLFFITLVNSIVMDNMEDESSIIEYFTRLVKNFEEPEPVEEVVAEFE